MGVKILLGDVMDRLAELPDNSIHCVVTSPPYWGLRDYGVAGQIGMEPTLGEHLAVMVAVFEEIRRVLRPDGTLWLNYGDCYATTPNGRSAAEAKAAGGDDRTFRDKPLSTVGPIYDPARGQVPDSKAKKAYVHTGRIVAGGTLKPKDLCMVPNRLAIALQEAGWWVRSEIIWAKPNPMPESITDRPATAHEKIFLLSRSGVTTCWVHRDRREWVFERPEPDYRWVHRRTGEETDKARTGLFWRRINLWQGRDYFYDADAVRQGRTGNENANGFRGGSYTGGKTGKREKSGNVRVTDKQRGHGRRHAGFNDRWDAMPKEEQQANGRNLRNWEPAPAPIEVWKIATRPFKEAHFATFPPELAERCIKAGCPEGGAVLDPFGGAGTTALVADRMGRDAVLIELNPEYAEIARNRIASDAGLLAEVELVQEARSGAAATGMPQKEAGSGEPATGTPEKEAAE